MRTSKGMLSFYASLLRELCGLCFEFEPGSMHGCMDILRRAARTMMNVVELRKWTRLVSDKFSTCRKLEVHNGFRDERPVLRCRRLSSQKGIATNRLHTHHTRLVVVIDAPHLVHIPVVSAFIGSYALYRFALTIPDEVFMCMYVFRSPAHPRPRIEGWLGATSLGATSLGATSLGTPQRLLPHFVIVNRSVASAWFACLERQQRWRRNRGDKIGKSWARFSV